MYNINLLAPRSKIELRKYQCRKLRIISDNRPGGIVGYIYDKSV